MLVVVQNFIEIKTRVETELETQSISQQLRAEIIAYGTLKRAWGLGHI